MDALQWNLERIRSDLSKRRPGPCTDVRGIDEDAIVPLTIDPREGSRCSSTRRIRRGGDTCPDEPPTVGTHLGPWVALLPAEALRPFPQARDEAAATKWMPTVGFDLGFVPHAKLDRIEPARDRHLVHYRLEREHSRTLTGRTHNRRCRYIKPRE